MDCLDVGLKWVVAACLAIWGTVSGLKFVVRELADLVVFLRAQARRIRGG